MNTTQWTTLAVTAWLGAGLALAGGGADDVKKLQGKWTGKDDIGNKMTLVFEKDGFTLDVGGKAEGRLKGTFKADATKKPHDMDLAITEDPYAVLKGKKMRCIWEITGDTLKWCASEPGKATPPKEFSDKGDQLFVRFTRSK